MRMCNTCGIEAVGPETGECTYCPGHRTRQKSEVAAPASEAASADDAPTAAKGAKPGKAAKGAK